MTEVTILSENEQGISRPAKKLELHKYLDADSERAWELANLIRIAATDYKWFDDWFTNDQPDKFEKFVLEQGRKLKNIDSNKNWICTSKNITKTTIDKYSILSDEEIEARSSDELEQFYKYRIIKTYEFVAYYPTKLKVDIDRFGFIAERIDENSRRNIFIVFRGTREPAEWLQNLKFKQIGFLSTNTNQQGFPDCGNISRGFNTIYTTFRQENLLQQAVAATVTELIEKLRRFDIQEKSIYEAISEFYSDLENPQINTKEVPLENTNIYITGHSLGGALATIAAMDIVATDRNFKGGNIQSKLKKPVTLYTFASPRVGDNKFADKFNELISNNYMRAFRLANSEDLVTKLPLPVWLKTGFDIDEQNWDILDGLRSTFNAVTGGVFETDYQHVGMPIYFTHQARRYQLNEEGERVEDENGKPVMEDTATLGDNHHMTGSYCGSLPEEK